jgi:FMN phosphatase YigB (HAD superfamily)
MTAYRCVALDVGGVIYYDEPFELAWILLVFERARAVDPSYTHAKLLDDLIALYKAKQDPQAARATAFTSPATRGCWLQVRRRWVSLVQPLPGAVKAVRDLAGSFETCIVANQPPECLDALDMLSIRDYIQPISLDSIVRYSKPDPRLLKQTLSQLRCPASETLVVGNRWDHDVAPAQLLGCATALVLPHGGWQAPEGVDAAFLSGYRAVRSRLLGAPPNTTGTRVTGGLAELAASLIPAAWSEGTQSE